MLKSNGSIKLCLSVAAVSTFAVMSGTLNAQADSVRDFYAGKTISIITSTGQASTYTTYAQLVAEFLGRHIPGTPNIIVQTMPGAGGVRAASHMAHVAPQDGSVLATVHETLPIAQVLKPESVKFDMSKFRYIGVMSMITSTLTVAGNSPATTIAGAREKEVILGSTGPGSITHQLPTLLNNMYGTKFKLVAGYQAMGDMTIAIERGELHGRAGSLVGWTQTRAKEVAEGKFVHMLQVNLKKDPGLPDVPLLVDMARNDRERTILEFISASAVVGRSIFAPPGTPEDRVIALRKAFEAMIVDPRFLEAAAKRNHEIHPVSAADVEKAILRTVSVPKDIANEARLAMGE
ncbi:MAG: tripartite tricarboxylate transporter substrate-binding protein [Beijerinckiaceae bacterium]|nr:tripartite tricarboxylate transporter substrate-binding protein [Beijerinckiaceae bacterium]